MSPENPEKKRRFTLNLPTRAFEALEEFQEEGGHGSIGDVVRDAVEVYLSLHDGRRKGLELYFRDPKNNRSGPIWLLPGPAPNVEEV